MRHPDGSYDQPPGHYRVCHPACRDEYELVVLVAHDLFTVRDLELGMRASEMLDMLEDEGDIAWWAQEAQLEAVFRL